MSWRRNKWNWNKKWWMRWWLKNKSELWLRPEERILRQKKI